jgi:F0F1-type ATP synthase delta subunit
LGYLATTLSGRLMSQAGGPQFQQASIDSFLERLAQVPADEYKQGLESSEASAVQVQVASAGELSTESRDLVEAQIGELLEQPVEVRYRVDPALIAGATLRFGDVVIDGSLAGQLQTLTDRYLVELGQEAT